MLYLPDVNVSPAETFQGCDVFIVEALSFAPLQIEDVGASPFGGLLQKPGHFCLLCDCREAEVQSKGSTEDQYPVAGIDIVQM